VPEVGIEPTLPEGNGILRPTTGKKTGAKTRFDGVFAPFVLVPLGGIWWRLVGCGHSPGTATDGDSGLIDHGISSPVGRASTSSSLSRMLP
jgi:hypothetical protein